MDKYYSLMRQAVHHGFVWLANRQWAMDKVDLYCQMLKDVPLTYVALWPAGRHCRRCPDG